MARFVDQGLVVKLQAAFLAGKALRAAAEEAGVAKGTASRYYAIFRKESSATQLDISELPPAEDILAMTDAEAHAAFARLRWPETDGKPVCPHCKCSVVHALPSRPGVFRCAWRHCRRDFSVTSGTQYAGRKLSIKLMLAFMAVAGRGKSAHAISVATGLNYRTAHRQMSFLRASAKDRAGRQTPEGETGGRA